MQRLSLLAIILVALVCADLSAHATPVRVRARSALTGHVLRTGEGLALRGRLADDRARPVVGAPVHAHIKGLEQQVVRTGVDGGFELTISSKDSVALAEQHGDRLPWRLEFAGGPNYGPVTRSGAIDLHRAPTRTTVKVDRQETTLDEGPLTISVAVRSGDNPVSSVPVHLRVANGPELIGDADQRGRVNFLLSPSGVRAFGQVAIEARYPGDGRYAPSQAMTTAIISKATRLTLRAGREGDTRHGRYRFSGRLTDEAGALADKTIGVVVSPSEGGRAREFSQRTAITDENGVFLVAIEAREFLGFEGETVDIQAVFQPSNLALQAARSERAVVPVPEPPGVPLSWYFACLAAAAGLVLLAIAVHLRFWLHLRSLWIRRRLRRHAGVLGESMVEGPVGAGPLGSGRRDWLAGVVVECDQGAAVPEAEVCLTQGERRLACEVGQDGSFSLGPIPKGAWHLAISGPEIVPREAELRFPHGGELDGMRVKVETVRARVRDVFKSCVEPLASNVRWGIDTPAQMEGAVRDANQPVATGLSRLRQLVEAVWFGRGAPSLEDVSVAEGLKAGEEGGA